MVTKDGPPVVGVLGGLGPRASAQFMRTLYAEFGSQTEQTQPRVVLWSDPTIPDRTEALLAGDGAGLVRRLEEELRQIDRFAVDVIVICCITAHCVLHAVEPALRTRVMSLVDAVVREAAVAGEPHLLLATTGTRRARLFERHPGWAAVADLVVMPTDDDQAAIHDLILRLKRWEDPTAVALRVRDIASRYPVGGIVAACTEIHLVTGVLEELTPPLAVIDPLRSVARQLAAEFGRTVATERTTNAGSRRSEPPLLSGRPVADVTVRTG